MPSISYEKKDYMAVVTLNRPEALNAFHYESLLELEQLVEVLRDDKEVRIIVFTGAGDKSFSVGADLKEREKLTTEEVRRNVYKIGEVFNAISELPQPTIAAINGYAFGGGMELALACDFRIAVQETLMGLTETSLAIIPGAGGTQRLPRLIGETKALELILTAKKITSEEAEQIGLVQKLVPRNELTSSVKQFAESMLANGPIAVQQAKRAIKHGMNVDLQTGLHFERLSYEQTIPTQDRVEALRAFREKRKPQFKGK